MSDKDLLGQADGLMRRHAVGSDTGAVPILTDLVEAPPGAPLEAAQAPVAPSPAADDAAIEARVMAEVDRRLTEEMERVRHELAATVADAVRRALADRPVK